MCHDLHCGSHRLTHLFHSTCRLRFFVVQCLLVCQIVSLENTHPHPYPLPEGEGIFMRLCEPPDSACLISIVLRRYCYLLLFRWFHMHIPECLLSYSVEYRRCYTASP